MLKPFVFLDHNLQNDTFQPFTFVVRVKVRVRVRIRVRVGFIDLATSIW